MSYNRNHKPTHFKKLALPIFNLIYKVIWTIQNELQFHLTMKFTLTETTREIELM